MANQGYVPPEGGFGTPEDDGSSKKLMMQIGVGVTLLLVIYIIYKKFKK